MDHLPPIAPNGKIEVTTTYLQMFGRPSKIRPSAPTGTLIMPAFQPTASFYRYLYNSVGKAYFWTERRNLTDKELTKIIHDPDVSVYVLYVHGVPAGFTEIDRRQMPEIELAYFGLIPEFIGLRFGSYFLNWAIHAAWDVNPQRLWVNTSTLDHPNAQTVYEACGFQPYDTLIEIIDDPRI